MAPKPKNNTSNRSHSLIFSFLVTLFLVISETWSYPASTALENAEMTQGDGENEGSWILVAVVSISTILVLIIILFQCGTAGGCCGGLSKIHWFGRTRQDAPMSFENPVSEGNLGTMMTPLSQIDVRTLELGSVVFEPLPTIDDLTPLSNQAGNAQLGGGGLGGATDGSGSARSHNKSLPTVIPFAAADSDLYAHDWFDDQFKSFPRGNLEYVREIGKGWFGQVMEAEARDIVPFARKIRVLVKVLKGEASQIEQMRFLDESRLYRDANQANILKLLGHSIEKLPFLLIMEQCPQGDLKSYLISNVTRADMLSTQGTLIRMALDIAQGLEWMSSCDFVHHDLASRNCQVASEDRIVVGDYGLATHVYKDDYYWNSNVPIPLRWAAPETLHCTVSTIQTLKATKFANIWSFAVVLWEIMEFAKLPYFELSDEEVISRVIADKNYNLGSPTLPYIPLKNELYEIMRSCWSIDPLNRPNFSSIVARLKGLLEIVTTVQQSAPPDEFESKWEQLGARASTSSADDEKRRKKSVSFTGLQKELQKAEDRRDSRVEVGRTTEAYPSFNQSSIDMFDESKPKDIETVDSNASSLDPDEDQWEQRIERGDISLKVLAKSQSVQDLMVLTHVEPGDFGDPDSLPYISKQNDLTVNASSSSGEDNRNVASGGNAASCLKKSSSDTALTSASSPSKVMADSSQNSKSVKSHASGAIADQVSKASSSILGKTRIDPDISSIQRTSGPMSDLDATPDPEVKINSFKADISTNVSKTRSSKQEKTKVDSEISKISVESNNSSFHDVEKHDISKASSSINVLGSIPDPTAKISVIQPSPNRNPFVLGSTPDPGVKINVVRPTPSPDPLVALSSVQQQGDDRKMRSEEPFKNGRIAELKFSTPEQTNGNGNHVQRHTSTPKRSGSSPLPLDGYDDTPEDVFETQGTPLNSTCPISPISKLNSTRGISQGELLTSILVGASDDLGLSAYQAVSTQLQESTLMPHHYSEDEDELIHTTTNNTPYTSAQEEPNPPKSFQNNVKTNSGTSQAAYSKPFVLKDEVLNTVSNGGTYSLTPRPESEEIKEKPKITPRVLFNDDSDESPTKSDVVVLASSTFNSSEFNPSNTIGSWDVVNSDSVGKISSTGSWAIVSDPNAKDQTLSDKTSSGELSTSKTANLAFTAGSSTGEEKESSNEQKISDDFWTQQLQSFQNAANNTRSLFELSLGGDEEYKSEGDKFVEDIEAANEELGSLVLHDLEDVNEIKQVVPETRESAGPPKQEAKLAFLGDNTDNNSSSSHSLGTEGNAASISSITNVQHLKAPDSLEVTKTRKSSFRTLFAGGGKKDHNETFEESEEDEDEASICKEFTPSKWNHSLIPARPAIKSPAAEALNASTQQNKSSLKKSVSFERKKPSIIYKYPPPPPASDSEDDDRFHRRTSTVKPSSIPISSAASLDWELTQEELEDAEIHHEDWGEDEVIPKADPMDVYRISGYENDSFHIRGSSEPFVFQPSTLGELRHTRDRLKLDLSKGEASLLDEDLAAKGAAPKLDSGVGSSTNVSPFNHCDMLPSKKNNDNNPSE